MPTVVGPPAVLPTALPSSPELHISSVETPSSFSPLKMRLWLLFFLSAAPAFGARVVCYWNGKSFWREGTAKVTVDDIKAGTSLCTHLIYGFAAIDDDDYHVEPIDKKLDSDKGKGQWKAVTALKKAQPGLSILLSVGGNQDKEDEDKYFDVLEKAERRTKFINSVINILREYGFDGIDLAWQFPTQHEKYEKTSVGSIFHKLTKAFGAGVDSKAKEHKDQFTTLCRELKAQIRPEGKLLSIALLPHVNYTNYFDIRSLMPHVDMVNLWTVDFRTPERSPEKADYVHPLFYLYPRLPHQNVETIVKYWLDNGAEAHKLNLGIATWARTWKLNTDSGLSGTPPLVADGPGDKGPHTKKEGFLAYYELCTKLVSPTNPQAPAGTLRKVVDPEKKMGAYGFSLPDKKVNEGLWVGYEEPETVAAKTFYAKSKSLGGVAILDVGLDDSRGICDGNKFPITRAAKFNLDYAAIPAQAAFGSIPSQPAKSSAPSQPAYSSIPAQSSKGIVPVQPSFGNVPAQTSFGSIPEHPSFSSNKTTQTIHHQPVQTSYANIAIKG